MFFASDNAGPAAPQILSALSGANTGYMSGYGADPIMESVTARIREVFEAPEAAVHLVTTGTAANALALATLSQPWQTIFCSPMAHINEDECNAPEFYSGAKLTCVPATDAKLTAKALRGAIEAEETRGVHGPQRGPVSITQVTEKGTVYTLDEIAQIGAVCRDFDLPLHLDGARFANAMVTLGCTAAEMTWKAGVDAVSFGGTKNGCIGVEAVVFFDPATAWEFQLRRKRGGHLMSKHRYLSAQMEAYLADDLWLDLARSANAACTRLAQGLRGIEAVEFAYEPQANIIFFRAPRALHAKVQQAGATYYLMDGTLDGDAGEMLTGRLVCDWSMDAAGIDAFLALF